MLVLSCSTEVPDAVPDLATADVGDSPDAASPEDVSAVADIADTAAAADLPATSEFSLRLQSGATDVAFDHARYGLTAPAVSTSGQWEIYVEAYRGGAAGCPTATSPTPDQTVIISGLLADQAPGVVEEGDGLSVVMFDFEGLITTEPILRATAEAATIDTIVVCTDCVPDEDPNGYVAFALAAPLDSADLSGVVVATHCPSLDTLQ